jgi:hypothetical protein
MSAKAIFEADGKAILNYHLTRAPVIKPTPLPKPTKHNAPPRLASLYFPEDADVKAVLDQAEVTYPWLLQSGSKFVAKPDQLIKRRGKSGLLCLNKGWPEAKAWIAERAGKAQKVEHVEGVLRQFLVEPFVPHPDGTEYYININSVRDVSRPLFESVILPASSVLSHSLIAPNPQPCLDQSGRDCGWVRITRRRKSQKELGHVAAHEKIEPRDHSGVNEGIGCSVKRIRATWNQVVLWHAFCIYSLLRDCLCRMNSHGRAEH